MKINDLTTKVTNTIYEVCVENVCDSIRGYFTTLEEAKEQAYKEKEGEKNEILIIKMTWDNEEQEYIYNYDSTGGLKGIIAII